MFMILHFIFAINPLIGFLSIKISTFAVFYYFYDHISRQCKSRFHFNCLDDPDWTGQAAWLQYIIPSSWVDGIPLQNEISWYGFTRVSSASIRWIEAHSLLISSPQLSLAIFVSTTVLNPQISAKISALAILLLQYRGYSSKK